VIIVLLFINTRSAVLTTAGIAMIVIAVPLGMFLWLVAGQRFIDTMQLLGLFLILCIGADDIFVLTDVWKQSGFQPSEISQKLDTRFGWTCALASLNGQRLEPHPFLWPT
jgi:hypothetical protein